MGPAPVMVRTPAASSFQLALSPHLPLATRAGRAVYVTETTSLKGPASPSLSSARTL